MLRKFRPSALLGAAAFAVAGTAYSQNEQFVPMNGYWVGPYAAGGSGIFGGFIDFMNMINARVVVLGLALLVGELHAVDAAVARIDHVHVVDESSEDAGAAGCVGADPVTVHRDELLVLRIGRACAALLGAAARLIFRNIGTLLWMAISLFLQVIGMNSRAYYSPYCHGWENPPVS